MSDTVHDAEGRSSGQDFRRKQRGKNLAVALALVAFAVIVYVVSIVRMAGA